MFVLVAGIFTLMAVCIFGARWPVEFRNEFHGTLPELNFSFYLAVVTVPLTLLAGIFVILDIHTSNIVLETKVDRTGLVDEQDYQEAEIAGSSHVRVQKWPHKPSPQVRRSAEVGAVRSHWQQMGFYSLARGRLLVH